MKQRAHRIGLGSFGTRAFLASLAGLLMLLAPATLLPAAAERPTEYQVKAAYLYNFGKFVRWPGAPADTFAICVLGRDPFGAALDQTVSGETIDGKRIVIRRPTTPRDAAACRILYISASEETRLRAILDGLGNAPVLTVSDMRHFTDSDGMIQFVLEGDRVRFEVNLAAAQRAQLAISSDLLKVAAAVDRRRAEAQR